MVICSSPGGVTLYGGPISENDIRGPLNKENVNEEEGVFVPALEVPRGQERMSLHLSAVTPPGAGECHTSAELNSLGLAPTSHFPRLSAPWAGDCSWDPPRSPPPSVGLTHMLLS